MPLEEVAIAQFTSYPDNDLPITCKKWILSYLKKVTLKCVEWLCSKFLGLDADSKIIGKCVVIHLQPN